MPMRLAIRHETRYDYDAPVTYSAQRLHLWPADFAAQRTIAWSVAAPGFDRGAAEGPTHPHCVYGVVRFV